MAKNKSNMKKFITGAVTATMVASAIAPVVAADTKEFSDITGYAKETQDIINNLVDKGIINGTSDTTFSPTLSITRGQVVKMLGRYLVETGITETPADWDSKQRFKDVPVTYVDKDLVKNAAIVFEAGVFQGNEGVLNSAGNINRENMALVLDRAAKEITGKTFVEHAGEKGNNVADLNDAKAEAQEAIKALNALEISTVTDFNPKSDVTRAQFATFLSNAIDVIAAADVPAKAEITSVKALNDTRVEVKFGEAIDKDFIREAEVNGKYFAIYTEGNSVQSNNTVLSDKISFSADGKTATFDLKDDLESGKKYYVALLNGDNNKVADVVHSYGPTVLKEAASAPSFDVSAVSDKIYVKYNTKMKDTAKDVENYTVYDEGNQELGSLSEFIDPDTKGEWVNLNDKKEVEFTLGTGSDRKLQAGKSYKLVVKESVETDNNKKLSESNRTIKVTTPSVKDASPVAKVARVTAKDEITLYFDKDIVAPDGTVNINKAQLNLKTSTGKTIDVDKFSSATVENENTLVLSFNDDVFDRGITYRVDMPANVVQNGIFTNAMNTATTGLVAKAQDNVSIASMKAQILADPKNDAKADLVLTFDQVPNIDQLDANKIVLFDGRDRYELPTGTTVKVYGNDTSGKSIIIEDVSQFEFTKDNSALAVQAGVTYDLEIATGALETDSFDSSAPATNKSKLKASTKGISVSRPIVDEVRLQSAEKIEIEFEENIVGNIEASDLSVNAFVSNRSDIFTNTTPSVVSGSGYYDVKINGNIMTITAKTGVKFPTSIEETEVIIDEKSFTNSSGKVGNEEIVISNYGSATVDTDDVVDNAAPVIVSAEALSNSKQVELTFSESLEQQGADSDMATLFFTDKGEKATEGEFYSLSGDTVVVQFKESYWKDSTDLSKVTVEYKKGNNFYLQDADSNKVATQKITGLFKQRDATPSEPGDGNDGEETPEGDVTVKAEELGLKAVYELNNTTTISVKADELDAEFAGKTLTLVYEGEDFVLVPNSLNANILAVSLPGEVSKATVDALNVKVSE